MELSFNQNSANVLVVDDFYKDPAAVRKHALEQQFYADDRFHKGLRTKERFLFPYVKEEFERLLGGRPIQNWLNHQYNGVYQYCTQDQPVVYHSDAQAYAAVIYLTPDAPLDAGTSFFKSKALGLRLPPSDPELERQMYEDKLLDPTAWELVDRTANVFNRLVIWNAKLVHAASSYFGTTKEDARLFHLFFFD